MTAAVLPSAIFAASGLAIDPATPWGLAPESITATSSALASYQPPTPPTVAGETPEAYAARCDSWDEYIRYLADSRLGLQIDAPTGLAIQPVCGTIVAGADPVREYYCGLFDMNRIATAASRAATDEAISALIFIWDSSGGYSPGITSTLAAIAELRALRPSLPVLSYVPRRCESLAYWIACTTQEVHANPDAMVGGIGTYILSQDSYQAYMNEGLVMRLHTSGLYKGMGAPGIQWNPAWYEELDNRVKTSNARFQSTVTAHRPGVSADQMTGLSYEAQSAAAFVDSTAFPSADQFLAAVISQLPPKRV